MADYQKPIELVLARHMVGRAIWVGPAILLIFWLLRGPLGAASAGLGLAVVIVNFFLAGALLSFGMRISLGMYHAAALIGFFLRLGLITGTMLVVVRSIDIDRIAFGISTVAGYLVLLSLEAVAVARGHERELDWAN